MEMMELGGSLHLKEELVSKMGSMSLEEKKSIEMSPDEKRIKRKGDIGQAERLKEQKRKRGMK